MANWFLASVTMMFMMVGCKTTSSRDVVYKIKITEGDTLAAIAQKYDTTPRAIQRFNEMGNSHDLEIGGVILVKPGPYGIVSQTTNQINARREKKRKSFLFGSRDSSLIWPVEGKVTSEYGRRWGRKHTGMDIGAKTGTPIYAAAKGFVESSQWKRGYGKTVVINHGSYKTLYAHCSKLHVKKGQRVAQGQKIGAVGQTGNASGPHLHFEYHAKDGKPRNPRHVLKKAPSLASRAR